MHVHRKRSPLVVVVLMLVLAVALALSASGRSSTDNTRLGAVQTAGGFGEVYKANPKTLAKTLFSAKLMPAPKMAHNIALAAFRRADMKVNQNLALKCWKNN